MSAAINPMPWNHFPRECLIYFVFAGILHLGAFVIGCLVLVILPRRQAGTLPRRIGKLALFTGLLLVVGSLFNGLWSCLVWGRLYHSTDYVFDFSPLWPITQEVIDMPFGDQRGQLLGVTLIQLQGVWLLFAFATWGVTAFLYRTIRRRQNLKSEGSRDMKSVSQ